MSTDHIARYILQMDCPDQPGIISRVTSALYEYDANITESEEFNAPETGWFFMRLALTVDHTDRHSRAQLEQHLQRVMEPLQATWRLRPRDQHYKVLILCSAYDHCVVDLLYRHHRGEIPMEIVGIVSNHPKEKVLDTIDIGKIPYHYMPVTKANKAEQEAALQQMIDDKGVDLVVLARYMQILSTEMCTRLKGKCINIHHSFLPGFKGAKPYHQAHHRGVKLIGATAHFVTSDLDEGPIIKQDVTPVTHADDVQDLIRIGRGLERKVLSEAVRLWLEDRVFVKGNRTVVFSR